MLSKRRMQDAKVISESAIIGQLGVSMVERTLAEMGLLFHPTGQVEAGIDGFVELRDAITGKVSNFIIVTQIKSTQREFPKETETSFEWPCSKRDLEYWLQGNAPVVLIVVRPRTNEAYWMPLNEYFRDIATRAKGRILFDRIRNRFDVACRDDFVRLAVPRDSGIYRPPVPKPETLYLNVVPAEPPEWIYVARTEYQDRRELFAAAKRDGRTCPMELLIRSRTIISVIDLSQRDLSFYCDQGTVERHHRTEWEHDPVRLREMSELLTLCLRQKAKEHPLLYDPVKPCLYFAATASGRPRRLVYWGLHSETEREVFGPRHLKKEPSRVAYYRHSAFQWQFLFLNGNWSLQIIPTYHFTRDGIIPDIFANERLKKIKEKEKNAAVFGQVIMWAHVLARPATMFERTYPFLAFGELQTLNFNHGIDDAVWLAREEDEELAPLQAELEFLK